MKPVLVHSKAGKQKDFTEVRARQRLNELTRLARYRRENGLDIGTPLAWGYLLSDIALARRRLWTKGREGEIAPGAPLHEELRRQVEAYFWRIGLGDMVASPIARAMHAEVWSRLESNPMVLVEAAVAGELLEVTSIERADCGLRTIDDVDQGRDGRRKEAARVRERTRRILAGATPREHSAAHTRPWEILGVSRATYYRRKAETSS